MKVLPFTKDNAISNMATDRALLACLPDISGIIFRHYEWTDDYVSFGYSQKFEDVQKRCKTEPNLLMRRPTGGGIVFHENDWTYTLLIPPTVELFNNPRGLYELSHSLVMQALEKSGVQALHLAPCPRACDIERPKLDVSECFIQPELNDVLVEDQKVAGAAIKKSKQGVLLQGSIIKDPVQDIDWKEFESHFLLSLAKHFNSKALPYNFEEIKGFKEEKQKWVSEYSQLDWNQSR